jgi:hypothetical protein
VHETDLHLEPNEASDLSPVFEPEVLRERGWDLAFVTVLDEAHAEDAIAVLAHEHGAAPGEGWEAIRLKATPSSGAGKTEDAEACARRDGFVYVLGSQFGKKAGPLAASRSWVARAREASLADALDGGKVELEMARTRFSLHRAVNDALAEAAVELLPLGPGARAAYIDETIALGAAKGKRWAGRVRSGDQPINVEGLSFRADGRAVLGLRYPVTAAGHPLLVEVDLDAVFEDPDAVPPCSTVWTLETGTPEAPVGVRALHSSGDDRFDAVVGDLDASGKSATVLEDHPQGGAARSRHVRFELPLVAAGGAVGVEDVHDFGEVRRVEGIATGADGHAYYVIDDAGHVALRTLIFD